MQDLQDTISGSIAGDAPKKIFVVDTNVLLHDPFALNKFQDNEVVIPLAVIEELDTFKRGEQELARNARTVLRLLDRARRDGNLLDGVAVGTKGCLRVVMSPMELEGTKVDNIILRVAQNLQKESNSIVTLVTKDTNLRIKADAIGLKAEDYLNDRIDGDTLYTGQRIIEVSSAVIEQVADTKELPEGLASGLVINEFVLLKAIDNAQQSYLCRYLGEGRISPLQGLAQVWGIRPRNMEQQCALDLLLDDDIALVTLVGKAGTGKTLFALAAGLQRCVDDGVYTRMLVSRPVLPMGKDLGYLPGDVDEKLRPWMQPIYDNLEYILSDKEQDKEAAEMRRHMSTHRNPGPKLYEDLIDQKLLSVEPLTYIRGRSIPHQYLIVDEAQNLTPHEVKTIITRAGDGTKIVLTGDPNQIDNPYVDAHTNGLSYLVERFKGQPIFGHITLARGERSALAELASNLL